VEWEAFLEGLAAQDRQLAESLATAFGLEAARHYVRFHLVGSLDELERALNGERQRVKTQITGLYESIDVTQCPAGWMIQDNRITVEGNGTRVVQTDVSGPNAASGFFERAYNAVQHRIELRNAFLRLDGLTLGLPNWVTGQAIEMVRERGTPTHVQFTLYQFKLLGVPAGRIRWWRRLLHWLRLRSGPFTTPGMVTSIRMRTIWNLETILHLHWLRQRYPKTDLSTLISHTASVRYAEDYAIQSGYRLLSVSYVTADEQEIEIDGMMKEFEDENPVRRKEHDEMLARYSFDRQTAMKQNFDIELTIVPR
jgi:hypothetical protein